MTLRPYRYRAADKQELLSTATVHTLGLSTMRHELQRTVLSASTEERARRSTKPQDSSNHLATCTCCLHLPAGHTVEQALLPGHRSETQRQTARKSSPCLDRRCKRKMGTMVLLEMPGRLSGGKSNWL